MRYFGTMAASMALRRFQPLGAALMLRASQRLAFSTTVAPQVTKLQNGTTVVSVDNDSGLSTVGVFVNAGSQHENHETLGSAFYLSHMGYKMFVLHLRLTVPKSTHSLSSLRLTRLIEAKAHSYAVTARRSSLVYQMDALRSNASEVTALLSDVIVPALPEWEVRDQRPLVQENADSGVDLLDIAYHTAYRGQGLGAEVGPAWNIPNITNEGLQQYVAKHATGSNVALVGVGVEHAQLVADAEKNLGTLPAGERAVPNGAAYVGGEYLERAAGATTSIVLAFESAGWGTLEAVAQHALVRLLGGSKARAGPGDSRVSRLAQLGDSNSGLLCASAFHNAQAGTGLIGVQATAAAGQGRATADSLRQVLEDVARGVTDEEAARASAKLRADVCNHFDAQGGVLSFLGADALTGNVRSPSDLMAGQGISVSAADLQGAAKKLLDQKNTFVAVGDLSGL